MAGSRKTQRSVRVVVSSALVGVAALVVLVSVVSSTLVSAAAVFSVVAGAAATRIVYREVLQTRRDAAVARAAQARSFRASQDASHAEHVAFTVTMSGRLRDRDAEIGSLTGRLVVAERRADQAETRVKREAQRANEAQDRLAALLDEVLGTAGNDVDADHQSDLAALPATIDLMGWDAKVRA